jgi:alkylhydroperoxidase/carboxymuconolactone decarboxylase family protein YurZ
MTTPTLEDEMSNTDDPTPARRAIGDFAPKLVSLTDEVLFGDVWERAALPKRDRSLITVAAPSSPVAIPSSCATTSTWPRSTGSARMS